MNRAYLYPASLLALAAFAGCTKDNVNAAKADDMSKPSASRIHAECPNFKDVAVQQKTPVWCWAASAEMVHKYYGENDITQEQLAKEITNVSSTDPKKAQAAGLQQIMVALNPDIAKERKDKGESMLEDRITSGNTGKPTFDAVDFAIGQTAPWSATSDDLIDAIASQNPAIVGLRPEGQAMGHAVVVYGTDYEPVKNKEANDFGSKLFGDAAKSYAGQHGVSSDQVDASGVAKGPAKFKLSQIEYVDPMDGKRYKLNAQGFKDRVDFIMTKQRAREILERQMNVVK